MSFQIHKTTAVYGIVLIIAATIAYSTGSHGTGFAVNTGPDIDVKINSISPATPKFFDKRITLNFAAKGAETTSAKLVFFKFNLEYPSKKNVAYTAFMPAAWLKGNATKTFMWNLDQRGTYKLTVTADPSNSIKETNEQNNMDSIIFKV